ncbi:hypothetical protein C7B76_05235 [filamentous cyanobacterium CCP2]|nr:hypothetical protein C7B76_05235 [filamentous cyanobacterium CCP2]
MNVRLAPKATSHKAPKILHGNAASAYKKLAQKSSSSGLMKLRLIPAAAYQTHFIHAILRYTNFDAFLFIEVSCLKHLHY